MMQTGTILGTAYYLSPEQAQGHPVDGRSDTYSLGVVLYEMLAGKRPFEGDSPVAIAYKHVRETPVPPSKVRAGIPSGLETIVLTAMAKRQEDRYQSAAQMRQDIAAFLEGRQVTAVLPSPAADETQVIAVGGPRRRAAVRRPGWALALALGLLVGGLALGTWSLVNLLRPTIGATKIPNVVGKTPTEAERLLRLRNLDPSFQGNEASDSIAEGLVTRQRPGSRNRVARGSVIRYWVSSGLPFVGVPEIKGKTVGEALAQLRAAGLAVGQRTEVFDDVAPADTVIDQNPRAGDQVRKGTKIDLTVSKGQETGVVPDVIGRTEAQAYAILGSANFKVTRIEGSSDTYDAGLVFDQDPKGGATAKKGDTVTIFVSQGPAQFSMPDVRGDDESSARLELESHGLVVQVLRQTTTNPSQRGRVADQSPPAGTTVRRGQSVTISVWQ
jgi:serine/threonine-protein kinase